MEKELRFLHISANLIVDGVNNWVEMIYVTSADRQYPVADIRRKVVAKAKEAKETTFILGNIEEISKDDYMELNLMLNASK